MSPTSNPLPNKDIARSPTWNPSVTPTKAPVKRVTMNPTPGPAGSKDVSPQPPPPFPTTRPSLKPSDGKCPMNQREIAMVIDNHCNCQPIDPERCMDWKNHIKSLIDQFYVSSEDVRISLNFYKNAEEFDIALYEENDAQVLKDRIEESIGECDFNGVADQNSELYYHALIRGWRSLDTCSRDVKKSLVWYSLCDDEKQNPITEDACELLSDKRKKNRDTLYLADYSGGAACAKHGCTRFSDCLGLNSDIRCDNQDFDYHDYKACLDEQQREICRTSSPEVNGCQQVMNSWAVCHDSACAMKDLSASLQGWSIPISPMQGGDVVTISLLGMNTIDNPLMNCNDLKFDRCDGKVYAVAVEDDPRSLRLTVVGNELLNIRLGSISVYFGYDRYYQDKLGNPTVNPAQFFCQTGPVDVSDASVFSQPVRSLLCTSPDSEFRYDSSQFYLMLFARSMGCEANEVGNALCGDLFDSTYHASQALNTMF